VASALPHALHPNERILNEKPEPFIRTAASGILVKNKRAGIAHAAAQSVWR
jgi:hypothetical protein